MEGLKQVNFSFDFHTLNFLFSVGAIAKRPMFRLLTKAKPDVFVFWSNVGDGSTHDNLGQVPVFAGGVTKGLRMGATTSTPFVQMVLADSDFAWFLVIQNSKLKSQS